MKIPRNTEDLLRKMKEEDEKEAQKVDVHEAVQILRLPAVYRSQLISGCEKKT